MIITREKRRLLDKYLHAEEIGLRMFYRVDPMIMRCIREYLVKKGCEETNMEWKMLIAHFLDDTADTFYSARKDAKKVKTDGGKRMS